MSSTQPKVSKMSQKVHHFTCKLCGEKNSVRNEHWRFYEKSLICKKCKDSQKQKHKQKCEITCKLCGRKRSVQQIYAEAVLTDYICSYCKAKKTVDSRPSAGKYKVKKITFVCEECGKEKTQNISLLNLAKKVPLICGACKQRKTLLKKTGFENASQNPKILEKKKLNSLRKYGVEYPSQAKDVREKISKSLRSRSESQKRVTREKTENTSQRIYGCKSPMQANSVKRRVIETNKANHGGLHSSQCKAVREKYKQTCRKRYNVEHVMHVAEIKDKIKCTKVKRYGRKSYNNVVKHKQTCLERYGVESYSQTAEFAKKRYSNYHFDKLQFDSFPELCFFLYHRDLHKIPIRNTEKYFEYMYNGKVHRYFPDFEIDGEFYEIKGNQFLREDDTWQNPFDHSLDEQFEAKHQCAIQNKVKILYSEDYQKCIDYVLERYGKRFKKSIEKFPQSF